VRECHKTGLVDTPAEIELFNGFAKNNGFDSSFMRGSAELKRVIGYSFHGIYAKAYYERAQLLMAAGIFQYHTTIFNEGQKIRDRWALCYKCGRPQRLSLDLNVRVCFWILLCGLGITLMEALYELKERRNEYLRYKYQQLLHALTRYSNTQLGRSQVEPL
jgi:hypothetical protein